MYVEVINDRRSEFPISAIGIKKPEKFRASTGFEPVTSANYQCDALPVRCSNYEARVRIPLKP